MNNENKKVSEFNSNDYKDLPIEMRTGVIMTAKELLEIQRKNRALIEDGEHLPSYEGRKNKE